MASGDVYLVLRLRPPLEASQRMRDLTPPVATSHTGWTRGMHNSPNELRTAACANRDVRSRINPPTFPGKTKAQIHGNNRVMKRPQLANPAVKTTTPSVRRFFSRYHM